MIFVIMPTYQRADMLPRAIKSVIASTYTNWKLVIIDDGSNENEYLTKQNYINKLNDDRIIFLRRQVNGGCSAARNTGLKQILNSIDTNNTTWTTYIDDDDEMDKNWLTAINQAATNDVDVILGNTTYVGPRTRQPHIIGTRTLAELLRTDDVNTTAFAHRTILAHTLGPWAADIKRQADTEIIYRYTHAVGNSRVALINANSAYAHSGHKQITTTLPNLEYTRTVHLANPWSWNFNGKAVLFCASQDVQTMILHDNYDVGTFIDFTTITPQSASHSMCKLVIDYARRPDTDVIAYAMPTYTANDWPKAMRHLSNGATLFTSQGCIATRVGNGEAVTRIYTTIKKQFC